MPGSVGVALHAERQVHGIPPHVVDDPRPADEAARDLPGVEAGAQAELDALLGGVALEDRVELDRELDRAARVVDPRRAEAAAREIALPGGAHALDAVALGGLVEGADRGR